MSEERMSVGKKEKKKARQTDLLIVKLRLVIRKLLFFITITGTILQVCGQFHYGFLLPLNFICKVVLGAGGGTFEYCGQGG